MRVIGSTHYWSGQKETGSDLPSLFSIGADYKMTKKFDLSMSFNSYHDKGVDWGNNIYGEHRTMATNGWEVAFGGQYQLLKKFAVS